MTGNKIEQEAKFWIGKPKELEERLKKLNAVMVQKRTFEINLRFDNRERQLSSEYKVLRLRQDQRSRLTFKGPSDPNRTIAARKEIEVEVSDFQNSRDLLEALGYQVIVTYEKFRAVFNLGNVEVSLDEMPFGFFCEIEGPDEQSIRSAADQLELNWEVRSKFSYLRIFAAIKETYILDINDLTFKDFEGKRLSMQKIGLTKADSI